MFVDDVPPPCSILVLDSAGRLDRELATLAAHLDDMRDLLRGELRASLLLQAVARVIVTAQQLRALALNAVVGDAMETIALNERALQARISIVVRALYALKQNENWLEPGSLAGRFRTLRDFNLWIVDRVAQIHSQWLEQRAAQQAQDAVTGRALAYAALDDAEFSFERLGCDADVERFLRVGAANACEAVAVASQELAATFGVVLTASSEQRRCTTQPAANSARTRTAS